MTARRTARQIDDKLDEVIHSLGPGETLTLDEIEERTGLARASVIKDMRSAFDKLRDSVLRDWYFD